MKLSSSLRVGDERLGGSISLYNFILFIYILYFIYQFYRTDFRIMFSWRITNFSDILRRISDFTVTFNGFLDPFCPVRIVK